MRSFSLRPARGKHVKPVSPARYALPALTATLLPVAVLSASPASAATPARPFAGIVKAAPVAPTTIRISAPDTARPGQQVRVWGRLLTDGQPLAGQTLELQHPVGKGWITTSRFTTDQAGLGSTALTVLADKRVRVYFRGSETAAPELSPVQTVDVVAPKRLTTTLGQQAVLEASRHRGAPYQWGAAGPSRFDCSGFTMYVYGRLGRSLPHSSGAQANVTAPVAKGSAQLGDLVFFRTGGRVSHVGIYAGGGMMWAAPSGGDVVRFQRIYSANYSLGRVG